MAVRSPRNRKNPVRPLIRLFSLLVALAATSQFVNGAPPVVIPVDIGERAFSAGVIVQQLVATNSPFTWGSLTQTQGPIPAIAPTLLSNGTFTWNPTGSQAGKKGSGHVLYEW